jgi:XXXCH domain-containing protein
MMSEELKKTCTRTELADRLEKLAHQFRSGKLRWEEFSGDIPDSVELEFHIKEKKGQIRCKLDFRWSSLAGYAAAEQSEILNWQGSFKQVKRLLSQSFKELKRRTQGVLTAHDPSLQDFMAASRAFVAIAKQEWPEATHAYQAHLDNLVRHVERGDEEAIDHEIQDLEISMVTCHRELR